MGHQLKGGNFMLELTENLSIGFSYVDFEFSVYFKILPFTRFEFLMLWAYMWADVIPMISY